MRKTELKSPGRETEAKKGRTKQFNVRMPVELIRELEEEAYKLGMSRGKFYLAMMEQQMREICKPCKGTGKKRPDEVLDSAICSKCDGYGKKRKYIKRRLKEMEVLIKADEAAQAWVKTPAPKVGPKKRRENHD